MCACVCEVCVVCVRCVLCGGSRYLPSGGREDCLTVLHVYHTLGIHLQLCMTHASSHVRTYIRLLIIFLWNSVHGCVVWGVRCVVVWDIALTSLVHGTNTNGYFDLAHLPSNYKQTRRDLSVRTSHEDLATSQLDATTV